MLNIAIRDLEINKVLDRNTMAVIFGGAAPGTLVFSRMVGTVGLGTLVRSDGHVVQRFKEKWINVYEDFGEEKQTEFLNSVVPAPFMA